MPEPTVDELGLNTNLDYEFPKNVHPDKLFTEPSQFPSTDKADKPLSGAIDARAIDEKPNDGKYIAG